MAMATPSQDPSLALAAAPVSPTTDPSAIPLPLNAMPGMDPMAGTPTTGNAAPAPTTGTPDSSSPASPAVSGSDQTATTLPGLTAQKQTALPPSSDSLLGNAADFFLNPLP
jgi:hypothetical protein